MHALARTVMAPYADPDRKPGERVVVEGPDVPIGGEAVPGFALLLHELSTNPTKYGALSSPTGHVDISCSLDGDELLLTWQERGGPPVDGPAASEGFGSLLARRTVTEQFGGRISYDWRFDGLVVHLALPLERLLT